MLKVGTYSKLIPTNIKFAEKKALQYLDLISWLESKIQNRPFTDSEFGIFDFSIKA